MSRKYEFHDNENLLFFQRAPEERVERCFDISQMDEALKFVEIES